MGELTWGRLYYLSLMTLSYIVGELTHFLVNTTSRALARDLQFGDLSCFNNETAGPGTGEESTVNCTSLKEEADCVEQAQCYWHYNGLGLQYQVRGTSPVSLLSFRFFFQFQVKVDCQTQKQDG